MKAYTDVWRRSYHIFLSLIDLIFIDKKRRGFDKGLEILSPDGYLEVETLVGSSEDFTGSRLGFGDESLFVPSEVLVQVRPPLPVRGNERTRQLSLSDSWLGEKRVRKFLPFPFV